MNPEENPRIVFMGTPVFAAECLKYLHEKQYNVCCVVTVPDKPAGRGRNLTSSPVKALALHYQIPCLQPENLKDPAFNEVLESYRPDLAVVVAFRMLPKVVWKLPRLGTFNLHASLLPQYRGASPINSAIMNGESVTGLTTFLIDHQIDTGSVLLQETMTIGPDETAGELHDRMMHSGARLVARTVDLLASGQLSPKPQKDLSGSEILHPAPKIQKENTKINWHWPVKRVFNMIRGLSPYPAAYTTLVHPEKGELILKIFRCSMIPAPPCESFPAIVTDERSYLRIVLKDGLLDLTEVQIQGKKRLMISEFLRGFKIGDGWCLGD